MKRSKPLVVILVGATASGKTEIAIRLAERFGASIISADSRQIYKELNIGVARPTPDELNRAQHFCIAHQSIHNTYTAADFRNEALQLIHDAEQELVIVAGGTGLYVNALLFGFDTMPNIPEALRAELNKLEQTSGLSGLVSRLNQTDSEALDLVDPSNPQRIKRAIELVETSKLPLKKLYTGNQQAFPYPHLIFQLSRPREELHQRINTRVDRMMADGLLDEVQSLRAFQTLNALQTVGYTELFDYLNDQHSLERAVELIKRNTRRYAKRQETWFRNKIDVELVSPKDIEPMAFKINRELRSLNPS